MFRRFLRIRGGSLIYTRVSNCGLFRGVILLREARFFGRFVMFCSRFTRFFLVSEYFSNVYVDLRLACCLDVFDEGFVKERGGHGCVARLVVRLRPRVTRSPCRVDVAVNVGRSEQIRCVRLPSVIVRVVARFQLFGLLVDFADQWSATLRVDVNWVEACANRYRDAGRVVLDRWGLPMYLASFLVKASDKFNFFVFFRPVDFVLANDRVVWVVRVPVGRSPCVRRVFVVNCRFVVRDHRNA